MSCCLLIDCFALTTVQLHAHGGFFMLLRVDLLWIADECVIIGAGITKPKTKLMICHFVSELIAIYSV